MTVSEASVDVLSALMNRRVGHPLSPERQYRIETSLGPVLRARGFSSVDALVVALDSQRDMRLEIEVVEALLNNETYFFRDRLPFELIDKFLRERLSHLRPAKRVRIWSAGVSTGQEAYSLAMLLDEQRAQWPGWHFDLLGTDVSNSAIERARRGSFTQFEVQRGLATRQLLRHFEKKGSDWQISEALRKQVRFKCEDVTRAHPVFPAQHDIILCRNLLLYLTVETRRAVFARLRAALAPDGVLVLGAAETILGQTDAFEPDPEYRGFYRPR